MRHLTKWLFAAACLLALLSFTTITDAQTAEPQASNGVIVQWQVFEKFEFWRWNADGTYTLAADLPDLLLPIVIGDIALSPDGQRVAFTSGFGGDNDGPQLYIVSFNPYQIKQYDAPGIGSIRWSPNSDALLLQRPSIYLRNESWILGDGDTYVFDLATETFTLVAETNEKQGIRDSKWSPIGDAVLYNQWKHEKSYGFDLPELHLVTRDGRSRRQLTNLNMQARQLIDFTQPSERFPCYMTDFKWSAVDTRWYYILTCSVLDGHRFVPSLFSVDTNGNNRLEIDFYEYFPEKYDPNGESWWYGYGITDFFPTADEVYLVVNSPTSSVWIVKVTQSGQAKIIAEIPSETSILAAISKSDSYIEITLESGMAKVINMANGQIQSFSPTEPEFSMCRAQWLDDETVVMNQVGGCDLGNGSQYGVIRIIVWNLRTGNQDAITSPSASLLNMVFLPQEVP